MTRGQAGNHKRVGMPIWIYMMQIDSISGSMTRVGVDSHDDAQLEALQPANDACWVSMATTGTSRI